MTITFQRPPGAITRVDVLSAPPTTPAVLAAARAVSPAMAAAYQDGRQQAGSLLVDLFTYLQANTADHPGLAVVLPVLRDAINDYRTGQSPDPLAGPRAVYQAIQAYRQTDPGAPDP